MTCPSRARLTLTIMSIHMKPVVVACEKEPGHAGKHSAGVVQFTISLGTLVSAPAHGALEWGDDDPLETPADGPPLRPTATDDTGAAS